MSLEILPSFTPRSTLLPFHRPAIADQDVAAVTRVLRSGWLTTGAEAAAFELEFALYVGASHAIAVSSCTAALHLGLRGLGVGAWEPMVDLVHDEVIVPTLTFTASAAEVLHAGGRVAFADVNRETFNLDAATVGASMTERTRGVVFVHMGGNPSGLPAVNQVANTHRAFVLEDAAHAPPSFVWTEKTFGRGVWNPIGSGASGSAVTAFSFYATKTCPAGEGGMLTTEDPDLAYRLRMMACHGVDQDAYQRSRGALYHYNVASEGWKYNLPDLLAALGRAQLSRADAFAARRTEIATQYRAAFAADAGIEGMQVIHDDARTSWHLFIVLLRLDALSIDRDRFADELRQRSIATSVHYRPLHLHPYYRQLAAEGGRVVIPPSLPNAEWLYARMLSLPIYPDMTDADVEDVIRTVQYVSKRYRR